MAENPEEREFTLYDLRVECIEINGEAEANYDVGDYFEVHGEDLVFPDGQPFSMYALSSLLPLLPAKQRETDPNDWMSDTVRVSGPDPDIAGVFEITRTDSRKVTYTDVSSESVDSE
ncbi:TIGR04076 family protein [Natrinema sp. 1APR25-10V2]|uniref:TIGR04076 family protein n=1 Tax=Natrinema sp. 1APR25-10V2 TaxID=2951081 RepID=UPI0028746F4A|nr:TIGR04076 family protein [Natrinema sp. 1APR25-10V2]MDS0477306.1 TIGR04076 family protein [Natrinema sp. 1APR25-10V2]